MLLEVLDAGKDVVPLFGSPRLVGPPPSGEEDPYQGSVCTRSKESHAGKARQGRKNDLGAGLLGGRV